MDSERLQDLVGGFVMLAAAGLSAYFAWGFCQTTAPWGFRHQETEFSRGMLALVSAVFSGLFVVVAMVRFGSAVEKRSDAVVEGETK